MNEDAQQPPDALLAPSGLLPPFEKSAVGRCNQAWVLARDHALATGMSPVSAILAGNKAFKYAMPTLVDADSIRDYIACVAQGILVGAIGDVLGTKLLYAAQVARSAINGQARQKSGLR